MRIAFLTPEQKQTIGENAFQLVHAMQPKKVAAQLVDFFRKIIEKMNYDAKMLKDEVS